MGAVALLGLAFSLPWLGPGLMGNEPAMPATRGDAPFVVHVGYNHTFDGTCDPVTVTVHFQSEVTGGRPPYFYTWRFGDGGTSSDPNPSHTYTHLFVEYTVVLWVTGLTGVASDSLIIELFAPPCASPAGEGSPGDPWLPIVIGVPAAAVSLLLAAAMFGLQRKRRRP